MFLDALQRWLGEHGNVLPGYVRRIGQSERTNHRTVVVFG